LVGEKIDCERKKTNKAILKTFLTKSKKARNFKEDARQRTKLNKRN